MFSSIASPLPFLRHFSTEPGAHRFRLAIHLQQWAFGCAPCPAFYMCPGDLNSTHTLLAETSLQAQHSSSLTQHFYFLLCLRDGSLRIVQSRLQLFLYCLYPAGTRFILADVATETHKNNFPHLTTYQHFLIPGLAHSSAAAREEKK